MSDATQGRVKWFSNPKGFGFIEHPDGDEDIFVHYSQILDEGFKTLRQGDLVEFELRREPKGIHAANVVTVEEENND